MMDRALVAFRSRDLVDRCISGNVKYYFVLWSSFEEREGLSWTDVDYWKSFFIYILVQYDKYKYLLT